MLSSPKDELIFSIIDLNYMMHKTIVPKIPNKYEEIILKYLSKIFKYKKFKCIK